jgi:Holliday junction DNA helicase RuvA
MIATLTGKVSEITGGCCFLDVNGVGYEVRVPLASLEELAGTGGEVKLYTHLHLREDCAQLFGFPTLDEKRVFEKIVGVSGIGPKTALSILSVLTVDRFRQAVAAEDHRLLASVPGIGAKTAQRLVLELQGKLAAPHGEKTNGYAGGSGGEIADAVEALVALGYQMPVALQAVEAAAAENENATVPTLVRSALKRLAR